MKVNGDVAAFRGSNHPLLLESPGELNKKPRRYNIDAGRKPETENVRPSTKTSFEFTLLTTLKGKRVHRQIPRTDGYLARLPKHRSWTATCKVDISNLVSMTHCTFRGNLTLSRPTIAGMIAIWVGERPVYAVRPGVLVSGSRSLKPIPARLRTAICKMTEDTPLERTDEIMSSFIRQAMQISSSCYERKSLAEDLNP